MNINKKLIVFAHIPKTGGTTIGDLLFKKFSNSELYAPRSSRGLLENIQFKNVDFQKLKAISSHSMVFGRELYGRRIRYITMLRSPVKRIMSFYMHVQRDSNHTLHSKASKLTLRNFVDGGFCPDTSNYQTRFISGVSSLEELNDKKNYNKIINNTDLEKAKQNLINDFDFVGIQEYFNQSYIWINKYLKFKTTGYKTRKETPSFQKKNIYFSEEDIAFIKKKNEIDQELYSFAVKLFREKYLKDIKPIELINLRIKNFFAKIPKNQFYNLK